MKTADTERYNIRAADWRKAVMGDDIIVYHGDTFAVLEFCKVLSKDYTAVSFRGHNWQVLKPFCRDSAFVHLERNN